MKKAFAVLAAVALLVTPAVVYACSTHASIAANDFQNYLNGGTSSYGGGTMDGDGIGNVDTTGWTVWGEQSGGDVFQDSRTYTLTVTAPDGSTISWETTWGELPNGYLIEWALTNAAQDWFATQFDENGNLITNENGVVGDGEFHIDAYNG